MKNLLFISIIFFFSCKNRNETKIKWTRHDNSILKSIQFDSSLKNAVSAEMYIERYDSVKQCWIIRSDSFYIKTP